MKLKGCKWSEEDEEGKQGEGGRGVTGGSRLRKQGGERKKRKVGKRDIESEKEEARIHSDSSLEMLQQFIQTLK